MNDAIAEANRRALQELYWTQSVLWRVRPLFWEQHVDRENDVE